MSPFGNTASIRFRDSLLIRIGVAILVLGSRPLFLIILAAGLGLTRDPNPNPISPGLLPFLTFWPGVILTFAGVVSVRAARKRQSGLQR